MNFIKYTAKILMFFYVLGMYSSEFVLNNQFQKQFFMLYDLILNV